jgi:hypothetical protein
VELACGLPPLRRLLEGGGGNARTPRRARAGGVGRRRAAARPPFSHQRLSRRKRGAHWRSGLPRRGWSRSHLSLMARETAQVLIAGPALVERARGVRTTKEELGGARVHLRSGVVDNAADDERGVFALARRFLSYLPTNVWQRAPVTTCDPRTASRRS